MQAKNFFEMLRGASIQSGRFGRQAGSRLRSRLKTGRRIDSEEGNAIVEFAVTLPILLTIVTAIFVFGITLSHYLMIVNAAEVGAMNLAISRNQTTDPCNITAVAVQAAAPSLTVGTGTSNLQMSLNLNGTSYPNKITCSSSSTTTGAAGNLVQGGNATLTLTYPCSLAMYNINPWPSCNLVAVVTELVQ